MRLTDFNPRWTRAFSDGPVTGLSFECPHCRATRITVLFKPSFDDAMLSRLGVPWPHPHVEGLVWNRTGDTFETITLEPSVNAEKTGHWHGNITSGELITSKPG